MERFAIDMPVGAPKAPTKSAGLLIEIPPTPLRQVVDQVRDTAQSPRPTDYDRLQRLASLLKDAARRCRLTPILDAARLLDDAARAHDREVTEMVVDELLRRCEISAETPNTR